VSCVAGAAWERTCPEGLSFDLENRVCMLMENIIACGGSAPTGTSGSIRPYVTAFCFVSTALLFL
jgi:hypothetical protein